MKNLPGLFFTLLTAIITAAALYLGYIMLWMFAFFMIIILFISISMIIFGVFFIKYNQKIDAYVIEKGMSSNINLEYTNKFIFIYPRVELVNENGPREKLTIFPGKGVYPRFLKPAIKGVYEVGVKKIIIRDYFSLFSFPVKLGIKEKIYVTPAVKKFGFTEKAGANEFVSKESKMSKIQDKTTISDLREYKYGDTINRINWKATAKYNDVIVNNYENKFCPKTFVYVGDLTECQGIPLEVIDDCACEVAIALVKNIVGLSEQVTLLYEGKNQILDSDDVKSFVEYGMYLTERGSEINLVKDFSLIEKYLLNSAAYSKFVYISNNVTSDIYNLIKALKVNNIETDILQISKGNNNKIIVTEGLRGGV